MLFRSWGHYEHEIPRVTCDAIVELDFNSYEKKFEVRLIEVRPAAIVSTISQLKQIQPNFSNRQSLEVLDFRQGSVDRDSDLGAITWVKKCPSSWSELQVYCQRAMRSSGKLALDYQSTNLASGREIFEQLVGIAKYLANTHDPIDLMRLGLRLDIEEQAVRLGLDAVVEIGFEVSLQQQTNLITVARSSVAIERDTDLYSLPTAQKFFAAIDEEQFNRSYFLQVPTYAIQSSSLD